MARGEDWELFVAGERRDETAQHTRRHPASRQTLTKITWALPCECECTRLCLWPSDYDSPCGSTFPDRDPPCLTTHPVVPDHHLLLIAAADQPLVVDVETPDHSQMLVQLMKQSSCTHTHTDTDSNVCLK